MVLTNFQTDFSLLIKISKTYTITSWLSSHAVGETRSLHTFLRASPFDPGDEEHQVAVDFGAVDELVDVVGVDRLRRLQAGGADAVARWNAVKTGVITSKTPPPPFLRIKD